MRPTMDSLIDYLSIGRYHRKLSVFQDEFRKYMSCSLRMLGKRQVGRVCRHSALDSKGAIYCSPVDTIFDSFELLVLRLVSISASRFSIYHIDYGLAGLERREILRQGGIARHLNTCGRIRRKYEYSVRTTFDNYDQDHH